MNTAIITIIIFGLLILVHELGHFVVAKATKIKVEEFSIGMGPKLIGFKKGDTDYSLRILPIGGYNKMAGMEPGKEDIPNGFNAKTVSERMLVIAAGSFMNFLLAIILFMLVFSFLGVPANTNIIGSVVTNMPAAEAGLLPGDQIISVNGETTSNWYELTAIVHNKPQEELLLSINRDGQVFDIFLMTTKDPKTGVGLIGITDTVKTYNVFEGLKLGIIRSIEILVLIVVSLVNIIIGQAPAEVAGPIGIVSMIGQVSEYGMASLFNFAALLSLNLGLINLLPIPALDGSRLVFLSIEAIRGKPLDPKKENFVHFIGFTVLIFLMLLITYQDILRIFN